jgi:hypothetical protein
MYIAHMSCFSNPKVLKSIFLLFGSFCFNFWSSISSVIVVFLNTKHMKWCYQIEADQISIALHCISVMYLVIRMASDCPPRTGQIQGRTLSISPGISFGRGVLILRGSPGFLGTWTRFSPYFYQWGIHVIQALAQDLSCLSLWQVRMRNDRWDWGNFLQISYVFKKKWHFYF